MTAPFVGKDRAVHPLKPVSEKPSHLYRYVRTGAQIDESSQLIERYISDPLDINAHYRVVTNRILYASCAPVLQQSEQLNFIGLIEIGHKGYGLTNGYLCALKR